MRSGYQGSVVAAGVEEPPIAGNRRLRPSTRRWLSPWSTASRWQQGFVLLLSAFVAARCGTTATGYPAQSGYTAADLHALDQYFAPDVLATYHTKDSSPDEQRQYRDVVINSRIRAIDLRYTAFEQALTRDMAAINVGTDWAVIGLSAAGAIVGSATTKSILAAISGGLTGAKGSIDKNVFYNKTLPVLFTQMDALRRTALVTIRTGMQASTTEYPLEQALLDVADYYNAGTIPRALTGITAAAGAQSSEKTQQLEDIYKSDAATSQLRAFWKPDGHTKDPDNDKTLRDWLKSHGLDISITFFLHAQQYSDQRRQAAAELIK